MKVPVQNRPEPSIDVLNQQPEQPIQNDQSQPQSEPENPFGKEKFDAGVGVDEDEDPKKFIERLTGKLAQKLRSYNETDKDSDLNKFVINSLIPASVPNLDNKDVDDVIKKVKDNKNDNSVPDNNVPNEEPVQQEAEPVNQDSNVEESMVNEIIDNILNKKSTQTIKNKNPFKPKTFTK